MNADPRIVIADEVVDVEQTEQPFGKRWRQEEVVLGPEHLAALQEGKWLAVDVQEEYVVFVRLDSGVAGKVKGVGDGG
jgi:hypothetical protein